MQQMEQEVKLEGEQVPVYLHAGLFMFSVWNTCQKCGSYLMYH